MTRKSTITKELAIIERKLSETTNQVLKDALKKKEARLKSELKDASKTAPQLAQNLLSQKAKVKALSKIDFNDLVRRLAKKPEYAFLKTMSKSTVRTDLERKAKPVGWRFKGRGNYDKPTMTQVAKGKKSGSVYRESRAIRSDVNLNVRLGQGGGVDNDYIKKTYSNLTEKNGILTTKSIFVNKNGVKLLEFGFDPLRDEDDNTLFYYSWDYRDSGMDYESFRKELISFFEKTYKKPVNAIKGLYVGWDRKEKDTYAKGGTIGDSGTIIDTKSMYQGKMGFIEMDMGNEWIVKVLDNGKEKSVTVRKSGFKVMHDDQMSQGGVVINGISINVGDKGTYGRSKEQITITGITPKIINFTTSEGKKKGIYRDAFAKSYVPNGSKKNNDIQEVENADKVYNIQGVSLKKGDKFQISDDSAIYTFQGLEKNNRYGFDQIVAFNPYKNVIEPIWRIDTMESNDLFIKKYNGPDVVEIKQNPKPVTKVPTFKSKALEELKEWKKEKLQDIKNKAKSLGITPQNKDYIKVSNKLDYLVEDITKILKSNILQNGKYPLFKEFNVKSYQGEMYAESNFRLDKRIAYDHPNFEKDYKQFTERLPYATKDDFTKEFIGRLATPILGYKFSDYTKLGFLMPGSVGGARNNQFEKGGTMATGGKIKEGDTWEWHTTEYDPARGNNYKFVKKVTIVEIDNKGQVIAQEVGSSRKFIIRQPEKYLKKKI